MLVAEPVKGRVTSVAEVSSPALGMVFKVNEPLLDVVPEYIHAETDTLKILDPSEVCGMVREPEPTIVPL